MTWTLEGSDLFLRQEARFACDAGLAETVVKIAANNLEDTEAGYGTPWRTTVYCDTPDWWVYKGRVEGVPHLRLREYTATRPVQVLAGEDAWLELKEPPPFLRKERALVPVANVPSILEGMVPLPGALARLRKYAEAMVDARVQPALVTQYWRQAFAIPDGLIRITLDRDLTYFSMPPTPSDKTAFPSPIGPAIGTEDGVVIEIKWGSGPPSWLRSLIDQLQSLGEHRASKFETGVGQLLSAAHLSDERPRRMQAVSLGERRPTLQTRGTTRKMGIGKVVLLVEDNPDDEELTRLAFQESNIVNDLVVVHDGAEALDYIFATGRYAERGADRMPQVVLLDLKLPKIDGLEVLRRIRAAEPTRMLPVVILTSSDEQQDMTRGYNLGANSYVRKPVDFNGFAEAVRQLCLYWLVLNQVP